MTVDLTATFHVNRPPKRRKTICTGAVLAAFRIGVDAYRYCQGPDDVKRILRRHGWSVRSRRSSIPKDATIGTLRRWLAKNGEYDAWYYVGVPGHALLLDWHGKTVVDTDPRSRDRRKIVHFSKVTR